MGSVQALSQVCGDCVVCALDVPFFSLPCGICHPRPLVQTHCLGLFSAFITVTSARCRFTVSIHQPSHGGRQISPFADQKDWVGLGNGLPVFEGIERVNHIMQWEVGVLSW